MVRSNHVFSCKKIAKNALRFLLFTKKICIFATTLLCPLVQRCTGVTMMPPNERYFYPPKKHLIKHEDKGSRRDP